jgi:photosystem II stability/assembly factor-like uncharacterized protein
MRFMMSPPNAPRAMLAARLGSVLVVMLAVFSTTFVTVAQDTFDISWTQTSLNVSARRLYTPASGALFARTTDGLMRSDDGGVTWSPVRLPAAAPVPGMPAGWTRAFVVDPTDHTRIYVATADGVYKTDDDAGTWRLVLPADPEVPGFLALAVSPADNRVVYVALRNERLNRLRLLRSADGGQTWDTASNRERSRQSSCEWSVALLQAHATDSNRVFLAASCSRNAQQVALEQSADRGTTWIDLYTPKLAEPDWLLTGAAGPTSPILLALRKDDGRGGGSILARSQDDGASWTTILEHSGGGGMSASGPDVTIGGLDADPTASDRLLLGLNARQGPRDLPSQLRLSNDGGASWTDIGPPDLPRLHDVRFGTEGRMMFAATEGGVWSATAP